MSYQVLARKWRPQVFPELVGQQHVVDALTNALENDKLHHAYLFTGTRGVGKTTIARIFSKSLNCEEGQSANPCGKCNTCVDIADGRYVDLLEIDAASRTKVEDTRELLDNVQYRPTRGKYKVYLIDEVHMLSKHSFNALLKTLEEPPEHVKFLLATTDPQKLPVTILSRCLQFSLRALSKEQIHAHLAHILQQEKISFEDKALIQISKAAQGSIRDSLSLTDQAIAQGNNQVTHSVVANMLGLLDKNQILKLVKFTCEREQQQAMQQLDELCDQTSDYGQVLSQVLGLLHQIALTQIVPEICKLESDSAQGIHILSKSLSAQHIQMLYQIVLNGKKDLPHAPDGRMGLQMTILRMLAFSPMQKIDLDLEALARENNAKESQIVTSSQRELQRDFEQSSSIESNSIESSPDINSSEMHRPEVQNAEEHTAEVQSAEEHTAEVQSAEEHSAKEHSAKEHSAKEHSAKEHSAKEHSPEKHSAKEHSPEKHSTEVHSAEHIPEHITEYIPENHNEIPDEASAQIPEHAPDEFAELSSSSPAQTRPVHEHEDDALFLPALEEKPKQEDLRQEEAPDNTLAVLQQSKQLDDLFGDDDSGDSGGKKPEAKKDIATLPAVSSKYSLGHHFTLFDTTEHSQALHAVLANGEKLINAAQVDEWSAFVDSTKIHAFTRQLLLHANCAELSNPLKLRLDKGNQHLADDSVLASIKEKLSNLFGETFEVEITLDTVKNTPFEIQTRIDEMRLKYARKVVDTDEGIQELKKAFDANIFESSIVAR